MDLYPILVNYILIEKKIGEGESSLVVQWLRLGAFTAVAGVQYLIGELRSYQLCGKAIK